MEAARACRSTTRIPRDPDMARRAINRPEVALHWFAKPGGESDTFNMFPELDRIRCPTLVIGGEDDPMHLIESQADHRCRAAAEPRAVRTVRGVRARAWCPMRLNGRWRCSGNSS